MRIRLPRRTVLTLLIEILGISLVFIALALMIHKYHQTDLMLYYDDSLNLLRGQYPYINFDFEYPPLALLPIALPQLLCVLQPLKFQQYVLFFFVQNAIFGHFIAVLLSQIVSVGRPKMQAVKTIAVYITLIAINFPIVFCRYDIFSAFLTLLAFWAIFKQRSLQAGVWLGLGITAKLYPIVLLPVFSIYYLAQRQYQAGIRFLLGSLITVSAVFLPFALAAQEKLFSFLTYHKARGLHIETIPGGILLLLGKFGLVDAPFDLNYGAYHFTTAIAAPILAILPGLTWILLSVVLVCCLKVFRREYAATGTIAYESLATYITLTLLAFMITAKVFSPQYLIWLLPFLTLLRLRVTAIALMVAISVTTLFVYPILYHRLLLLQLLPLSILNLRNMLTAVFAAYLLIHEFPTLAQAKKAGDVEAVVPTQ